MIRFTVWVPSGAKQLKSDGKVADTRRELGPPDVERIGPINCDDDGKPVSLVISVVDLEKLERQEAADRYTALRAKIGSQAFVAGLLGLSGKAISFRERGQTDIKPEGFLALERLIHKKRKADYESFEGFRCVYPASGDEGRLIVDNYEQTIALMDDGSIIQGGEYDLIDES